MPAREPELVTEPLGGSPLARAALNGGASHAWYPPAPRTAQEWLARARDVRGDVPATWFDLLSGAFGNASDVPDRLTRAVREGGILVTTGQQPGLFGGPVYTWSKAISALALADELERATGIPTAPVFWAATDDADFAEASWTVVSLPGGAERLELPHSGADGIPMSEVPLGDVGPSLRQLERAAGSALDPIPLDAVRAAYGTGATVGSAYVALLRAMLDPLGIAVIDASHPAVTAASAQLLRRAVERAGDVAAALHERESALRGRGFRTAGSRRPGADTGIRTPRCREAANPDRAGRGRVALSGGRAVA